MWFVARCLKGKEPPATLAPEMVPPSFRTVKPADSLVENNNTRYSNPELDMISKDIEELGREKLMLETEIAQKEADIKIKSGEIKNLQSELDTLAATLKQLENQKGEAQKRLNDLKAQVDKLRVQAAEQAETVAAQEAELNSKKEQLEGLRQEERRLEQQKNESIKRLEGLTSNLQETQLTISQAKALITQLQEQTRQMNDAIQACDAAIESGDPLQVPDTCLKIIPEFRDPQYTKVGLLTNGDAFKNDGFITQNNTVNSSSGFTNDPFQNDPFKSNTDAFSSNDPFNAAFSKPNDSFSSDPFGESFSTSTVSKSDPFDAFGDSNKKPDATPEPDKDPFGCDPFAVLHAPTRDGGSGGGPPPRPVSPSPALPPKKSKQPPPRPAPPRPAQPPSVKKSMQSDPFGSSTSDPFASSGKGGFADFTDFDAKFSNKPTAKLAVPSSIATITTTTASTRSLDFTCDPFRDYRYEDPFNIQFDDEDPSNGDDKKSKNKQAELENFDPFGLNGRQSVPLSLSSMSDPFVSANGRSSVPPVKLELVSEDQQLAWAAQESLRLEEDRKKRQLQEQADLELAITLSKSEK